MVIFLIFVVALLFFSPCFSDPCPSAISCNTSFGIQYPFCVYNDSCPECDHPTEIGCLGKGPGCAVPIHIRCNGNDPRINLPGLDRWLRLENISYGDSILISTSDDNFHDSLLRSNCRNATILFESPLFEPPIDVDPYKFLDDELRDVRHFFSSVQCDPKTHRLPDNISEHVRSCSYDTVNCSAPPPFSFCWTFSFNNQTGRLTLLSASFSNSPEG